MTRPILIVGAQGQDGSLLADRLLREGNPVIGIARPGLPLRVPQPYPFEQIDVTDMAAVEALLARTQPSRLFYLAAVHHSAEAAPDDRSALWPAMTRTNCLGLVNTLRGVLRTVRDCRLVFAASSQMYDATATDLRVDEATPRCPRTFYGETKSWSLEAIAFARAHEGLKGATAILFNHESPRRAPHFVTRKITRGAAAIHLGLERQLHLLDLGARTDWSAAEDVVDALIRMADAETPQDYVIGSGHLRSIMELLDCAFRHVGLDWREHVVTHRRTTLPAIYADPTRIRAELGWQPQRSFETWVRAMVDADLATLRDSR